MATERLVRYGGQQRLFLAFAQIWHQKMREASRIELLKVDPHSPGQFRANGAVRNQAAFDEAFDVKPGDAMYLAPDQRFPLVADKDVGQAGFFGRAWTGLMQLFGG